MKFEIPKENFSKSIYTVKLGATKEEGGTRLNTVIIGGANTLPFHLFEGSIPHPPALAMEVFDLPPKRYPAPLLQYFEDVINKPAEMAKRCVERFGAQLISVRLEGTHPDKGNRSADSAVSVVKEVMNAVGVPLIITGHSHFDKNNEVMRKVAEATAGENCLFNWVEKDNYKTIAAVCLAHGHSLVAQSPIDVNIAKQLNIQLSDISFPLNKIVIDPLTSALGYGLEYTYSIMERIRMDGLSGDDMLRSPMLVSPGAECVLCKESWGAQADNPAWGSSELRSACWEIATAISLLLSGADLLIMYHPQALETVREKIAELFASIVNI